MSKKCETKLCSLINKNYLQKLFKNTYGYEASEEELEAFVDYINSLREAKGLKHID